jgi:putative tricarboxylic transport membrane protein
VSRPDGAVLVIAAALVALAALIVIEMRTMPVAALYARVGPTTFPYIIAAGLAALGAGTVAAGLRRSFPAREHDRVVPILWIVGGLVAQMILLKPAGFAIATGALFALTARGFGRGPIWLSLPIGIVFALVVWVIFALGLDLSLPAGPLERRFL